MKLFICEGEDVLMTAMEFRLQKMGFEIFRTDQQTTAITWLDLYQPDMAFVNVDLPTLNGADIIQHIRQTRLLKCPILAITTFEQETTALGLALDAGANDFISRPFKPAEMVFRIERLLKTID